MSVSYLLRVLITFTKYTTVKWTCHVLWQFSSQLSLLRHYCVTRTYIVHVDQTILVWLRAVVSESSWCLIVDKFPSLYTQVTLHTVGQTLRLTLENSVLLLTSRHSTSKPREAISATSVSEVMRSSSKSTIAISDNNATWTE